jgi:hypothetical protein
MGRRRLHPRTPVRPIPGVDMPLQAANPRLATKRASLYLAPDIVEPAALRTGNLRRGFGVRRALKRRDSRLERLRGAMQRKIKRKIK